MTIDPQLAEQVVAAVLERLGAGVGENRLVIDELVVTGELLEQKLGSSRNVQFTPGAIVTPTARDVIARLGVTWQYQDSSSSQGAGVVWNLLLSGTVMVGQRVPSAWSVERLDTDRDVVVRAVDWIGTTCERGVVVFSTAPHRVACLSNRHRHVRAAVIGSLAEARQVFRDLGANLLVLSPAEAGPLETCRVLQMCRETVVASPPADWTDVTD